MDLPIQYENILNRTQEMICDPLSFDEKEFDHLIKPIEKDLLKPFDLIIAICARKAIEEATEDVDDYLRQCSQQMQKHDIASLGFLMGGVLSFGAWYKIAQISSIAIGTGIGCTSGFVQQEYLCNRVYSNAKTSCDRMRLLVHAIEDVNNRMLLSTKQRFAQLKTLEIASQGKKKFDEHDDQFEDQNRVNISSQKSSDESKEEIKILKADNRRKDRLLIKQGRKMKDQGTKLADQATALKDQNVKLEDQAVVLKDQNVKLEDQAVVLKDQKVKLEDQAIKLDDQAERLAKLENLLLAQGG